MWLRLYPTLGMSSLGLRRTELKATVGCDVFPSASSSARMSPVYINGITAYHFLSRLIIKELTRKKYFLERQLRYCESGLR